MHIPIYHLEKRYLRRYRGTAFLKLVLHNTRLKLPNLIHPAMLSKQMARKQASVSEVAQAYQRAFQANQNSSESVELELRAPREQYSNDWMNVWRAAYLRILERYHAAGSQWPVMVECSARLIEPSMDAMVNRILQTNYIGTESSMIGLTKTRILDSRYEGIKISLSKEAIGDAARYRSVQPTIVRLRMRVGIELPELPGWRLDFTYVASTNNKSAFQAFITTDRKKFLPNVPLTLENFLDFIVPGHNRDAEIELEYLPAADGSGAPTELTIRNAVHEFKQIIQPPKSGEKDYGQVIQWLAKLLDQKLLFKSTLKQISNNPISLGQSQRAEILPRVGEYYLTDKADGERGFLLICPADLWPVDTNKEDDKLDQVVGGDEFDDDLVSEGSSDLGELASEGSSDLGELSDGLGDFDGAKTGGAKPVKSAKPTKSAKTPKSKADHIVCLITSVVKTLDIKVKGPLGITVLDLEHLPELDREGKTTQTKSKPSMFVFDALMYDGANITKMTFPERIEAANAAVDKLEGPIVVKEQVHLRPDILGEQVKKAYKAKRPYETDGLIFTHGPSPYWKDDSVFKWKPPERLTIDFLIMRAPQSMMNVPPYIPRPGYVMYLLFSGISQPKMEQYGLSWLPSCRELFRDFKGSGRTIPIQFTTPTHKLAYVYYHPVGVNNKLTSTTTKSSTKKLVVKPADMKDVAEDPLHRHVGEFIWIPDAKPKAKTENQLELAPGMIPWKFVKLRADKDANMEDGIAYGNSYATALSTFNEIMNPVKLEDLLVATVEPKSNDDADDLGYFAKSKGKDYRPMTAYNNFVKAQVLQQLADSNYVLDLMCGQGQDLFKYVGWKVKNLICVDQDAKALDELRTRSAHIPDPKWYVYPPKPQHAGIKLSVLQYDLSKDIVKLPEVLIKERMMPNERVDAVVCNLGLHYIIEDKKSLALFIKMLDSTLKVGGRFIYTSLNGALIHKMLQGLKKGEMWTSGMGKYSIRKDYTSTGLTYGLKIGVLHPFSNGEYYVENLLDPELVKTELEAAGYWQIQQGNFQDFWYRYEQHSKGLAARLQGADKFYTGLYQYSAFMRAV